ncbi:MAG: hypothetical protein HOO66_07145 [Nitrosarchaeum sp.]|nr:hypothetical protein [Nitrosarchaeum sp.]
MKNLNLPANLKDKIYQIKVNSQNNFSKIVSYFPLSVDEQQLIITLMNNPKSFDGFYSIFSDHISEQEWNKSKVQIIKRFQDELFDID